MELPQTTLNTVDAVEGSSTSADRPAFDPDSIGVINTVGDDAPAIDSSDKTLKHDDDDKATDGTPDETDDAAAPDKDADKGKDDDTRFDKHPRWQEMLRERDEAKRAADEARRIADETRLEKARLEGEREALRKAAEVQKPVNLPYKDITALSPDEIADWQATDPKGYAANLYRQVTYEAEQKLNAQIAEREKQMQTQSHEAKVKATYDAFEKANPDFRTRWNSGEVQAFMDANPGHNPISAYREMTSEVSSKTIEERHKAELAEAVAKAVKETEEKVNKNWQAKRSARVIGGGPSGAAGTTDADKELSDTKSRGGTVSVLTDRLRRLRAGTG